VKDQHYRSMDELIAEIKGKSIEEIANEPWDGQHLITVDELRAAGALDVPSAWRKSLRVEPDLFAGLTNDEDKCPETAQHEPCDSDGDGPANESG
jgi:hypothetical protein